MADRSVRVILRAEVAGYKQAMAEAAKATENVGKSSQTSLGRMVTSADKSADAWSGVGTTLLGVGGAVTALGTAMAVTGTSYNGLQQTTRAALTSLLGSAEAANAQMDRLDAFARTSPFAKQTFITAQQQMLAFGIETQKVIPYLSAVQDAVAAAGGSNAQIEGIVAIMAKIQSSAKVTAEDLMEFGNRGVNAAELIGSQMGMTGAQVRDSITAGTLDATAALDALVAGMSQRFDGASANVKDTFAGAIDRVKAAWRDLAAEFAQPLVGQNGGGALVDLANGGADALRTFQALPGPVKTTVGAIAGLTGGVALLSGGFLTLAPKYVEFQKRTAQLAADMPQFARGIGIARAAVVPLGVALAGATAVLAVWGAEVQRQAGNASILAETLDSTGRVTTDTTQRLADAFAETRNFSGITFDSVYDEAEKLGVSFEDLSAYVLGNADAIERVNAAGDRYIAGSSLWENVIQARQGDVQNLRFTLDTWAGSLTEAEKKTLQVAAASEEMGGALQGNDAAVAEAQERMAAWVENLQKVAEGFVSLGGVYGDAIDEQRRLAEETAAATEDAEDSWEDYYDGVSVSAGGYIEQLRKQVEAQEQWAANLETISSRVADTLPADMQTAAQAMIDELINLGPEGAAQVQLLASMTDGELAEVVGLWKRRGTEAVAGLVESAEKYRTPVVDIKVTVDDTLWRNWQPGVKRGNVVVTSPSAPTGAYGSNYSAPASTRKSSGGNFAAGGSVSGPGTETSDSIPALLSNGEHVWTAREVRNAGGHAQVERLRAMAGAGLLRLAAGGAVTRARADAQAAQARVKRELDALAAARRSGSEARIDAQRERVDAAKAARDDAREKASRLIADEIALKTDLRRGSIRDQATGSLSGAYSVVDQMRQQASSEDLSKGARSTLVTAAARAEKTMRGLYSQADGVEKRLAAARDRMSELGQIADGVSSRLSSETGIGSLLGQKTDLGYDVAVTSSSILANARGTASRIRAFAGKLDQLQKMGLRGVVLQEIAALGSEEGLQVADALIKGGKGDITSLNSAYASIDYWSRKSGQEVTEGFYQGGLQAATGLVQGLESQQRAIEAQITKIAKGMEGALKKALGIRSPSTVMRALGRHTGEGLVLGLQDETPAAARAMAALVNPTGASWNGSVAVPAATSGIDYDRLAEAMSRTQVRATVAIGDREAARLVQTGNQAAGRLS